MAMRAFSGTQRALSSISGSTGGLSTAHSGAFAVGFGHQEGFDSAGETFEAGNPEAVARILEHDDIHVGQPAPVFFRQFFRQARGRFAAAIHKEN